ncbi:MAG: Rossmann-like and DUF2520 domain-containing protein [Flavobacteriia bacterium]
MKEITIIGTGNVAFHFCNIFTEKKINLQLYARNKVTRQEFINKFNLREINSLSQIKNQFVLVCVNDDEILGLISELDDSNKIAYASGTVELNKLVHKSNLGVFYPLQSFSKERKLDYSHIPFLIEANNEYFNQELFDLAWSISNKVEFANSEKRKKIHLAAVFANNFTNHLLKISKDILDQNEIDWNLLEPLIKETVSKAIELDPDNAQTGPAKRNDLNTIQKQIEQLDSNSKEIYTQVTNSILENYGYKKL